MVGILAAMILGTLIGFLLRKKRRLFSLIDPLTAWVVRILLFLLGFGVGKDPALLRQIPDLGLKGVVIAVASLLGSAVAARLLLGTSTVEQQVSKTGNPRSDIWRASRGSVIAVLAFGTGLLAGAIVQGDMYIAFDPASIVLYLLMALVGIGVGADPTAASMLKEQGYRLALLPLAVVMGTFLGSLIVGLLWPGLPLRETLAVGAGFGYYSLSSLVIREISGSDWAAVALLSNISREILTLLGAPLLVRFFGPSAPAAAGGATSMDTTLAATVQYSGRAWAVPALFSGVVLTVLTPFAVSAALTIAVV